MKRPLFSGPAQIEIQGPRVLEFVSLDRAKAVFDVIGFSKPAIRLIDTRPIVHDFMAEILNGGSVKKFADHFSAPARVTILPSKGGRVTVRLDSSRSKNPRHMFWVAIGIEKNIPHYNYKLVEIQKRGRNKYALLTLYKRPRPRR